MAEQIRERHPFEVRCQSCGLPIVWFRTKTGKRMPVDAKTTQPTDREDQLDLKRHTSHFATCPQADAWRRS
jgi:glutamate/tyrosine decarboxylase-like PLP-dependent enzyme